MVWVSLDVYPRPHIQWLLRSTEAEKCALRTEVNTANDLPCKGTSPELLQKSLCAMKVALA
eukprot:CAMPEP_0195098740 /NCGR_PEP_ID=MMETSP0448-20130528/57850_1 /TAXON_ID=66468 /ORGANISM="Heterocapsa triquestra, Strain CCMP 448" /LENGTH=60 /DNA_ID=CAMNT_0040133493 /DNA_START=70 /DNA_END=248 /DNA_ORIENTATION=-